MIPTLPSIGHLVGGVVGGATGSVFAGIVSWMAKGLAVLVSWIWVTLNTATTPKLNEPWLTDAILGPVGLVAVAVTIAMMLASGIQAALAGRPAQILDAFKHGAWAVAATALTVTVMQILLGLVDAVSAGVWGGASPDVESLMQNVLSVMGSSVIATMGFLAVLMLLFMYLAVLGLAVALAMRNALIYMTAALAPLVFASSVLPMFRESARKIVHLGVSLIVSKLAIVITLSLAVKLMANAASSGPRGTASADTASSLGVLFAGIVCFAVASLTPLVLYKLMPTVEGAMVSAGVAGGWGRSAMTGLYGASTVTNLGSRVTRLASRPVGSTSEGGGSAGPRSGDGHKSGGTAAGIRAVSTAGGAAAVPVVAAAAGVQAGKRAISAVPAAAGATSDAAQPSSQGRSGWGEPWPAARQSTPSADPRALGKES